MLLVIALGGNALLQRGEPLEAALQHRNVKHTAKTLAELALQHQLVICHGNGPQVGLLALQNEAYTKVNPYPLDVLDAETQGMIGYLIQNELGNLVAPKQVTTLLTQIVVDKNDSAFQKPAKPIGPVYTENEANKIAKERGWTVAPDGTHFRRVVPSPQPKEIVELQSIKTLLQAGNIVICGGGGGIPVIRNEKNQLEGIEAVIDKDNTASLIAEKLGADRLIILTDVSAACIDFGTPKQRAIKAAPPALLEAMNFAKGSMGPKIYAAARFAKNTGKSATIGNLFEIHQMLEKKSGTHIDASIKTMEYYI